MATFDDAGNLISEWVGDHPSRIQPGPGTRNAAAARSPALALAAGPTTGNPLAPAGQKMRDMHHYAVVQEGNGDVGIAGSAAVQQPVIAQSSSSLRNFLLLRNTSAAANIYISFGKQASTVSPLKLAAGDMILLDTVVPQNDVYALADAASGTLSWGFSTTPGDLNS